MKKRFLVNQIIILILLTVCLVGVTYSWSTRSADKGGYLQTPLTFTYSSTINGNKCTANTYQGTLDAESGEITYGTESITALESQSVTADTTLYFRTEVANGADVKTNTSLFIDISYSTELEDNYFVGVTTPTKDYLTYAAESTEGTTNTIRWLPVVSQYEITASGSAYIEWYVDFEGSGDFQITNIVLTNN